MDVNKNSYTFLFATIMVVVVAALLSSAAIFLKGPQDENIRREKMQNILYTIGVRDAADETQPISRDLAADKYQEYVKQELVLVNGEVQEGVKAFGIDMAKELKKPVEQRQYPLYVAENEGSTFYIIPVRGKGLWGPIWGYIALGEDMNEIVGASFDHKGETPGLGADIVKPAFSNQFVGKEIFNDAGEFVSIEVVKGNASGEHQVDGISGGTITSVGVQDMLKDCIVNYLSFFESIEKSNQAEVVAEETVVSDSTQAQVDSLNVQ